MKKSIEGIKSISSIRQIIEMSILSSILLILLDKINIFTKISSNSISVVIFVLVIVYIMLRIMEFNIFDLFKLNIINDIDVALLYLLFTSGIFLGASVVIFKQFTYRVYICLPIILILSFILCMRYILTNKSEPDKNDNNIYDLKDLYENKIEIKDKAILIDEEAVNYDLLKRDVFINNLYNIIVDNKYRKKFVIGLQGHWGSGKSTILNIVKSKLLKERNDIIIIDDFDPWNYNDQNSMFRAMFDSILRESNIKFSISKSNKFVDTMYEILFDTKYGKKAKKLDLRRHEKINEVKKIKEMVNGYLKKNNKTVIFIIDNIDRADKENVLLLFKLVGSVLDFENITYILSYDDDKVKNIMNDNLKIDYDYIKKIIQLEVKVPIIDEDSKRDVVETCIKNLLVQYGVDRSEINKYNSITNNILDIVDDIRDLKRFLNSIITFYYRSNKNLNPVDTIAIETIKMYNIEVYESIIKNNKYFISKDRKKYDDLNNYIFMEKGKFNKEGKVYFDSLFEKEENRKFINILASIFPYVDKYKKGEELEYDGNLIYPRDKKEELDRVKNRRIYSGKFFDLYFREGSNDFTDINDSINIFINAINTGQNEISDSFIKDLPKKMHYDLFNTLHLFINEINKDKLLYILKILFKDIGLIYDTRRLASLSARNRVCLIISDILFMISEEEYMNFIGSIRNEYGKIEHISNINYWVEHNKEVETSHKEKIYRAWNDMYKEMACNIYDNNINIYEEYYMKSNIVALIKVIEDSSRDIKGYFDKVLNEKTIIRFLYDIMDEVISTRVRYYIPIESINRFTTEENINLILDIKDSYTEEEKIVLEIYRVSMEYRANGLIDDERLIFNQRLDLKL